VSWESFSAFLPGNLGEFMEAIQAFLETGGNVLFVIFGVTLLMWSLIVERQVYFRTAHQAHLRSTLERWQARSDQTSWYAHQVRTLLISQVSARLRQSLPLIKTLVALCPLLGLLGTVTGMIEVFDVMAVAGNGNPRAMASGVSKATIPTMAGMVAALSGLYFSVRLERFTTDETEKLADNLTHN
jgi:biopolymer transport protein ExbB